MTLAIQVAPAAALRASLTCTWPRAPLTLDPDTVSFTGPRAAVTVDTVLERDCVDMTVLWVELSVLFELLVLCELLVELLVLVVVSTERLELSVVVTA